MADFTLKPYKPPRRYVPKVRKHEQSIHLRVCAYLRHHYPNVYFHTDYAAGLRMTMNQAVLNKRLQSGKGWPDLFIPQPAHGFAGLFLELKNEGTSITLKIGPNKGSMTADPHIRAQAKVLDDLEARGFCARFAAGEREAQDILDWYLGRPENVALEF